MLKRIRVCEAPLQGQRKQAGRLLLVVGTVSASFSPLAPLVLIV